MTVMTVVMRPTMSLPDFLAWEERQEARWEFNGVRPVAMNGGTIAHDDITGNLREGLNRRLAGTPCKARGPNVRIVTGLSVRYPDVVVSCTRQSPSATVLEDPLIVFEVASKATRGRDVVDKNREYRGTASIQRYVVLEQTQRLAIVFARMGDAWTCEFVSGDDAVLALPEVNMSIPLDDIYAGIEFVPEPDPEND